MEDSVALSRRSIVKAGVTAMGAAAFAPLSSCASLAPPPAQVGESLPTTLYKSLTEDQRKVVCFQFEATLGRSDYMRLNAARGPGGVRPGSFNAEQQEMIRQIFIGQYNPDYLDKVMGQMVEDNGSFDNTTFIFFGEPGTGKFEFRQFGVHLDRRCDGDSVKWAALRGPIHYGHDAGGHGVESIGHPGDAYFYQARQASQVFKMLDGKQGILALVDKDPGEGPNALKLSGKTTGLSGIPMTELSRDQKEEVRKTLAALAAPFRKADADEAMKMIEANGFDNLHMAFYKSGHLDTGDVWNIWRIEGPSMYWYFHGVPHVHAYLHIRRSTDV